MRGKQRQTGEDLYCTSSGRTVGELSDCGRGFGRYRKLEWVRWGCGENYQEPKATGRSGLRLCAEPNCQQIADVPAHVFIHQGPQSCVGQRVSDVSFHATGYTDHTDQAKYTQTSTQTGHRGTLSFSRSCLARKALASLSPASSPASTAGSDTSPSVLHLGVRRPLALGAASTSTEVLTALPLTFGFSPFSARQSKQSNPESETLSRKATISGRGGTAARRSVVSRIGIPAINYTTTNHLSRRHTENIALGQLSLGLPHVTRCP